MGKKWEVKKEKRKNNGLVHLHFFCIYFAFSICFFFAFFLLLFCFFLLFSRQKAKKKQNKCKKKANRKSKINAKKMQMDKSFFFLLFFFAFCLSFFSPFILLLCFLDFADLLFDVSVFFAFILFFFQVFRKVRIKGGLADISVILTFDWWNVWLIASSCSTRRARWAR